MVLDGYPVGKIASVAFRHYRTATKWTKLFDVVRPPRSERPCFDPAIEGGALFANAADE
jgi:hypothetical protein